MQKLKYAVLHGPIHYPETGQYGPVLSDTADSIHKAVAMTQLEGEVLVEIPVKNNPKKKVKVLIDNSGFTHRVLADE
jgi:hypothetical protein